MKKLYYFYKFYLLLVLIPVTLSAKNTNSDIQLKNPDFEVSFSENGVLFRPTGKTIDWKWQLKSISGFENSNATNVHPTIKNNDVFFRRENITEQYLFKGNSIEQQFVISEQPAPANDLIIEGTVSSNAQFGKVAGGWIWHSGDAKVFLGDVFVYDAAGKQIPALMEVSGNSTKITVSGAGLKNATYPVTIDPQIGTSDFLLANNGTRLYQPALIYNSDDQKFFSVWTNYDNTQTRKENIFGGSFDLLQIKANPFTVDQAVNYPNFNISGDAPSGAASNSSATLPDVATSGTNYLAVWEDMLGPTYFNRGVNYRLTTNSGNSGNPVPVFNSTGYTSAFSWPEQPAVAGNNSKFLIVAATGATSTNYYVLGKYITGAGAAVGLDSITLMSSSVPFIDTDVDARPDGNFYTASATINMLYYGIAPASGSLSPNSLSTSGNIGSIAIAAGTNKALLVWSELSSGIFMIKGMWIDNTGAASGSPFRIDSPGLYGSGHPSAAYDPDTDSWLVVWDSNPASTPGTIISGREILSDNTMNDVFNAGNQTRTSVSPTVAYDSQNQEFWIAWSGGGNKDQILARRWVRSLNQTPSFTAGTNQTILEDAPAQTISAWATNINPGAPDESGQILTFLVTNDNNSLFSVQPAINASTGDLTFTPGANAFGTATVSVSLKDDGGTAHDAIDQSPVQTFTITISAVNDAPVFTAGTDQTVFEDAGAQTVTGWATGISAGAANESAQVLTFVVTNDNNALFAVQPAIDASGNLSYTPAANAFGTAFVSVYLKDDGGTANGGVDQSATKTFNINVTSVNDAPTFTAGSDPTVPEDAGAQTVSGWATGISAGPANESGQVLTFLVSNDNNSLFAVQPVIDAGGNLTYTPAANAFGTASVSVYLKDDGGTANGGVDQSATQTFNITVTSVNDVPTFTTGTDQTVLEDAGAQTVSGWATGISAGAANESTQVLTFVVANDNNALFSVQPAIDVSGNLTYTPAANAFGTASVSVYLKDDGGTANGGVDQTATINFNISVTSVNDVPTFTTGTDQTVLEDTGAQTVSGWATGISAGPANESTQVVTFWVSNDNTALFAVQPAIDTSGNLTYTPAANAFGTASVSVYLKDDGGTANGGVDQSATQTFSINVTSVNDAPTFTAGTDQTVLEDAGVQTITGWATGISAGAANEASQVLTFVVSNDNNALFSVQPAIDASGNLTFTPAANAFGTASVSVYLKDDGGTANGGVDQSATQTFNVNVASVNDAPAFTAGGDKSALENAGPQTVTGWATGISAGPANEFAQILTFVATNDNNALFTVQPAVDASGTLTFTPAADASGTATVSVYLKDDGGTANGGVDQSATQSFTISVASVNKAPTFTTGGNIAAMEDSGPLSILAWAKNISPGSLQESSQTLQFIVTNDNNALFSVQPKINALSGNLSFSSAPNAYGVANVTVVLKDDGGTVNGGVDTSTPVVFRIAIQPVNDKPFAVNSSIIAYDNKVYHFSSANFGFSDPADVSDALSAVSVLTAPLKGTLTFFGSPISAFPITIPATQITSLSYHPVINEGGNPYTSFSFMVADNNQSNASNGIQWSANQATMNIQVIQTNHAPTASNTGVTIDENQSYSFGNQDFGFTDPDAGNVFGGIKVVTLPPLGELSLNGTPVTAGAVIASGDMAGLTFTPNAWEYGNPYTSFLFQVMDANPPVPGWTSLFSDNSYTFSISVTRLNRAPVSADKTIQVNEDEPYSFSAGDFPFTDNTDSGDVLDSVIIQPAAGSDFLSFNGKTLSEETEIPADSLSFLIFTYTPQSSGSYSFEFHVVDNNSVGAANGNQTSEGTNTFTIQVIAVNDPPTTADFSIQTNQDEPFVFSSGLFPFQNPEEPGDQLSAVHFEMPVQGGTLQYFGKTLLSQRTIPVDSLSEVSFLPQNGLSGDHAGDISFRVLDNNSIGAPNGIAESELHHISVNIVHVNHAPEVKNPVADMQVDEFSDFSYTVSPDIFSDPDGDPLTIQISILSGNWLQKTADDQISGLPLPESDDQSEVSIKATDPSGESVETTFKVNIVRKTRPLIYGQVTSSVALPDSIPVVLFGAGSQNPDSVAVTKTITQHYFFFEGLSVGKYIVKAENPNPAENPKIISTFYESTSDWTKATKIEVANDSQTQANIAMLINPETTGNGTASGMVRVTKASSPADIGTINQGSAGVPIPFVDIFLTPKGTDNSLLVTQTKADGTYKFENIPDGEYIVSAQLPGFTSVNPFDIVVGNDQRTFENLNFLAFTGDSVVTDVQGFRQFDLNVYPNPTSGIVNLRSTITNQTMFVKVLSMTGQLVMKKKIEPASTRQFDISGLVPATYFIEVQQGNHSKTFPVLLMKTN